MGKTQGAGGEEEKGTEEKDKVDMDELEKRPGERGRKYFFN
jgi:hypothetical protein